MVESRIANDALLAHLAQAVAIRHGRQIEDVMGDVRRFSWPQEDGLDQREALIRFMCGRITSQPRAKRQGGP